MMRSRSVDTLIITTRIDLLLHDESSLTWPKEALPEESPASPAPPPSFITAWNTMLMRHDRGREEVRRRKTHFPCEARQLMDGEIKRRRIKTKSAEGHKFRV